MKNVDVALEYPYSLSGTGNPLVEVPGKRAYQSLLQPSCDPGGATSR